MFSTASTNFSRTRPSGSSLSARLILLINGSYGLQSRLSATFVSLGEQLLATLGREVNWSSSETHHPFKWNKTHVSNVGNRHEQFLILQNLVLSRMSSRLSRKNPSQDKHPYEIVGTYIMEPPPEFKREPLHMRCPYCRAAIWTRTENHISCMTWYFFGCWSLCIGSLHDVKHYCPKCNQLLGEYKGGPVQLNSSS